MKKLLFSLLSFGFFSICSAQKSAITVDTIMTPSVQCDMCKSRIEEYLNRIDGVELVKVNVKRKETVVRYRKDRTDIEILKASIANAGYDVAKKNNKEEIEIAANPDYYKLLPKCCKKPQDGGGMPKN